MRGRTQEACVRTGVKEMNALKIRFSIALASAFLSATAIAAPAMSPRLPVPAVGNVAGTTPMTIPSNPGILSRAFNYSPPLPKTNLPTSLAEQAGKVLLRQASPYTVLFNLVWPPNVAVSK